MLAFTYSSHPTVIVCLANTIYIVLATAFSFHSNSSCSIVENEIVQVSNPTACYWLFTYYLARSHIFLCTFRTNILNNSRNLRPHNYDHNVLDDNILYIMLYVLSLLSFGFNVLCWTTSVLIWVLSTFTTSGFCSTFLT